jgi:hypothetical protein
MSVSFPLLISLDGGPIPTPPATINAEIIAFATEESPGLTANLPGSLVEDLSSTATAGAVCCDQARVDAVNSLSPYAANGYILVQQGAALGVPQGVGSNGNVAVIFSGTPGYTIPANFLIGDGTNQYAVQPPGAVIGSGGSSSLVEAIATNAGIFAIPAGSVNVIVTSVPSPYTLSVTNPSDGAPAIAAQTIGEYRAQVLQAQQVALSGSAAYIKTLVGQVPGVNPQYISVLPVGRLWEVVVGGGDPYAVANAIFAGVSTPGLLTGSQVNSGRNLKVTIYDAPNPYDIIFVGAQGPPGTGMTVAFQWNTLLPNFTGGAAVNQYIIEAAQSYVNSLGIGQGLNLLELTSQLQVAITPVLAPSNLTTLIVAVSVNGVTVGPAAGTSVIPTPDLETYFYVSPSSVTSVQL